MKQSAGLVLTMSATLFLMPAPAGAQAGTLGARIKIDTERVIGSLISSSTATSSSIWAAASTAASSRKVAALRPERFPQDVFEAVKKSERHASCAGRAATSSPTTTGRTASVRATSVPAAGDGLGHGREQSLRHA